MLIALFLIALAVVVGSMLRPPRALWQRAITVLAVVVMLAVTVAWTLEYLARNA
jgi:hypothetical protein